MQIVLRTTRRLLIGAASLYCIGIVVLVLFWETDPHRNVWLELSNVFALWLFVPLVALVPLALLLRSVWLRVVVAVPLLLFVLLFGQQIMPRFARAEAGDHLRVVSYNALYHNQRIDDVIAAVRAQNADLVAFQEFSPALSELVAQQLRDEFPYQWLEPAAFDKGIGIISRYPLTPTAPAEGFRAQRAIVNVNGLSITLINVHLKAPDLYTQAWPWLPGLDLPKEYDTAQRAREAAALLASIDAINGPLVVLGDFNTGDREPLYADFAARMRDAFRETAWGFGYTFPNHYDDYSPVRTPVPLVRIDYVWSGGGLAPVAARAECKSGNSDHCMVVADLRMEGE